MQIRDIFQPLIEYYDTRDPREQILLMVGLPIILILLFYIAIWQPIYESNQKAKQQLANEQRFNHWFNQQTSTLSKNDKTFDWTSNNLPSVVEKTLEEFALNPWKKRIFQNQQQETIVTFDNIPYQNLIAWIKKLNFEYQVVLRNVNISATQSPAKVNAKLTLATTHDVQGRGSPFR